MPAKKNFTFVFASKRTPIAYCVQACNFFEAMRATNLYPDEIEDYNTDIDASAFITDIINIGSITIDHTPFDYPTTMKKKSKKFKKLVRGYTLDNQSDLTKMLIDSFTRVGYRVGIAENSSIFRFDRKMPVDQLFVFAELNTKIFTIVMAKDWFVASNLVGHISDVGHDWSDDDSVLNETPDKYVSLAPKYLSYFVADITPAEFDTVVATHAKLKHEEHANWYNASIFNNIHGYWIGKLTHCPIT